MNKKYQFGYLDDSSISQLCETVLTTVKLMSQELTAGGATDWQGGVSGLVLLPTPMSILFCLS